ncbi:anti-sigma B factor antagonist [Thermocatellispora tengchongensis]|uniref:Anti-sigma factor antagonist n=1 Tax=Thermocatellispora tengchongensis TaxID=1073253 RepID=A0A840P5Z4_9ACTN|nr:STAS domain-containing protein [Thermocatellispora tengchongensis]MBB5134762.1 anti-sigma B factor antagonist [Thermocatellispora tengchongensis]
MEILAWREGPSTVIQPRGDLDIAATPRLRVAIDRALHTDEAPCLILDLAEVPFCDSVGLGLLVHTLNRVRDARGRFVLAVPEGMITHLLTITNLHRHFETYPDLDQARASLATRT